MVEGVVPGEKVAGFGEQHHHQAHDHPGGGDVDLGGGHRLVEGVEGSAMLLDQQLHGPADALPESGRKLRLTLAGGLDGGQKGRLGAIRERGERRRPQQEAEGGHLRPGHAFFKPEVGVPLGKGVGVEAGVHQAPLAPVGEQGQVPIALSQPLDDACVTPPSTAQPDAAHVGIDEDGQHEPLGAAPHPAGFDRLPGEGPLRPLGADLRALDPATGAVAAQPEHFLQNGVEQHRQRIAVSLGGTDDVAAQLVGHVRGKGHDALGKELSQPGGSNQQTAVVQGGPPGVLGRRRAHAAPLSMDAAGLTPRPPAARLLPRWGTPGLPPGARSAWAGCA
ncbi:MAG: hypothetical protein KKA32_11000 [Actinobacteria bacterium]|nr:hypothetical protein [Actinomycetota bacterium]